MEQRRPSISPIIPPHDNERFRPYMLTGERILWTGRPKQGVLLSSRDVLLIPFSLMWGGFAIFWNVSVWTMRNGEDGPDIFFKLWGLPFFVAGLYLIVGRFFHDQSIRKWLIYAVTDQRVLIVRGKFSTKLKSLDVHHLPRIELSEHRDGSGTIAFEENKTMAYPMNGVGWLIPTLGGSAEFYRIANPRAVYQLIRNQSHV